MCTCISILSKEGSPYWSRSFDFSKDAFTDFKAMVTYIPRGHSKGAFTAHWEAKYAYLGLNFMGHLVFGDGINEKGLTGGMFFLEECTWDTIENLRHRGLKPIHAGEVVAWVLSHCATTDEVVAEMRQSGITVEPVSALQGADPAGIFRIHYTFTDAQGKHIVLEPTERGAFRIFEDTFGVMANSPTYDWHMTNLRNYLNLSGHNRGTATLGQKTILTQIENGSGLLGLPGDYTSPSRFVRAAFLSSFMDMPNDTGAISALCNIGKCVCVPRGIEKVSATALASDYTSYYSIYDIKNRAIYVHPTDSLGFGRLCMADIVDRDKAQSFAVPHTITTQIEHGHNRFACENVHLRPKQ